METDLQALPHSGGSRVHNNEGVWKAFWQFNAPNAVKLFMWKASNNLLPTKANLFRRGVVTNKLCPICELEEETVEHMLWSCPSAKDVWGCSTMKMQKEAYVGQDFMHVVEEFLGRCETEDMELFVVVARKIWF